MEIEEWLTNLKISIEALYISAEDYKDFETKLNFLFNSLIKQLKEKQ